MFWDGGKAHLIALIFANILAWASFFSVILLTNPQNAGVFGAVVLCVSLVIGLVCFGLLIWQLKTLKKN
mgnify:CR=1 FL=1